MKNGSAFKRWLSLIIVLGLLVCMMPGAGASNDNPPIIGVPPSNNIELTVPFYSGDDVKWIQSTLNYYGGYGLFIDGRYSPTTRDAVIKFQNSEGLAPNGVWSLICTITMQDFIRRGYTVVNGSYNITAQEDVTMMLFTYDDEYVSIEPGPGGEIFDIVHIGGGWHRITASSCGRALTYDGVMMRLADVTDDNSQLWRFIESGDGCSIQNRSGQYLPMGFLRGANGPEGGPQQWSLTPPEASKLTLSRSSVTLTGKGASVKLTAEVTPSSNEKIVWSSLNPGVAVVNNGIITAVGQGTTVVKATTASGLTARCSVTVTAFKPTGITVDRRDIRLTGKAPSCQLTASVSPSYADDRTVVWSTSNSEVAEVTETGLVYAMGPGTATVTAKTWNGYSASVAVTVESFNEIVSHAEIVDAARRFGVPFDSNAFRALEMINTKYYANSSITYEDMEGTLVFFFEGVGINPSSLARKNAMCVVVEDGKIKFIDRCSTTIPDDPFDPSKTEAEGMATMKSGVWRYTTTNHKSSYAALNISNPRVIRQMSKYDHSRFKPDCPADGINIHHRYSDNINSYRPNSVGCLIVGETPDPYSTSSAYARFIQAVGIVGQGATASSMWWWYKTGKVIIDRYYAGDYLRQVGYTDAAILAMDPTTYLRPQSIGRTHWLYGFDGLRLTRAA